MKLVAAIDQGTTSTRCILFDERGGVVSTAQREHRQITPRPGWLEHDAMEIWENTRIVARSARERAHSLGGKIAGVGVTNQRETVVVWDRFTGLPLHNAIVWQDSRTSGICEEMASKVGMDRYRDLTGLPLSTYFSAPKLKWLLQNSSEVQRSVQECRALWGNMDSWLIWNLTGGAACGVHVTDVTNASRTMLMDLRCLTWSSEMAREFDLPLEMAPEIRPSSDPGFYGVTSPDSPFGPEIPVAGALGDQQAALVGQGCFDHGEAKNTYGTGCFLLMNVGWTPRVSANGLLSTVAYKFGEEDTCYALEGSVAVAGAAVQWLRDQLRLITTAAEVEALAKTVKDCGDVYFVPAFSGLLAPHWEPNARGAIVGLTRYATKAHLARATLEAVAYQTREVIDAMEADSGISLATLKVDGGMVENSLLMGLQAEILGVPVTRPVSAETTSLGAAFAAGLAVGVWKDQAELKSLLKAGKTWRPRKGGSLRDQGFARWKQAVEKAKGWA